MYAAVVNGEPRCYLKLYSHQKPLSQLSALRITGILSLDHGSAPRRVKVVLHVLPILGNEASCDLDMRVRADDLLKWRIYRAVRSDRIRVRDAHIPRDND